jgi:sialate O-acetylesterase
MKLLRAIIVETVLACIVMAASPARAEVALPAIFGDHMVLQQQAKVPVWGTADPGEKIVVTVGDHTAATTASPAGQWRVDLEPFGDATPPATMTVAGKNTVKFVDVLIGDVWLASGQSNMAFGLQSAYNAKEEGPRAKDPQLRLLLVSKTPALHPLADITSPYFWKPWDGTLHRESEGEHRATWLVCEPHAAGAFSAVAYFFGKELRGHLKRPIGLIGSYWPGTVAESWTSLAGLKKDPPFASYLAAYEQNLAGFAKLNPEYQTARAAYQAQLKEYEGKFQQAVGKYQGELQVWQKAAAEAQTAGRPAPDKPKIAAIAKPKAPASPDGGSLAPANLFHGMIAPLVPFAIKGVIWYQGESNTRAKAPEYRLLFPRLIADWREQWGQGDFPFLFVQISHFPYAGDQSCGLIREAQLRALSLPNTGMAVTVDIPCDDAGHPHDKLDPGRRLALAARRVAYGESLVSSGPLYASMTVEGSAIRIRFTEIGGGLIIGKTPYQPPSFGNKPIAPLPTDRLVGFTIAGADRKFVPAGAVIDGGAVLVSSPQVPRPQAVRFAWGDAVQCNLYNQEGLPASPFRTDDWNAFTYRELAPGLVAPSFPPATFPSPSPAR